MARPVTLSIAIDALIGFKALQGRAYNMPIGTKDRSVLSYRHGNGTLAGLDESGNPFTTGGRETLFFTFASRKRAW